MIKNILALLILMSSCFLAQAQTEDYKISSDQIGPYQLEMDVEKNRHLFDHLVLPDEGNQYNGENVVKYKGEEITIRVGEHYSEDPVAGKYTIYSMKTASRKFKTASGMGVGNTREELISTYKYALSFQLYPGWTEEGKVDKTTAYFTVSDPESYSSLSFKLVHNIVVEIEVYYSEGGC